MDLSEITSKRVVFSLPGMEHSQVRADIIYKSVGDLDLTLDAYYPAGFTFDSALPAVLFIHGDGPAEMIHNVKNWGQYVSWGQLAAASGLIGIPFNHRSDGSRLSGMVSVAEDVHDLVEYVRRNAPELNVDPDRLSLWACSAGVPYLQEFFAAPPPFVRCMVAYYGMMDYQQVAGTLEPDIPAEERAAILRLFEQFSLLGYLQDHPAAISPIFIAQAGQDDLMANASIDRFYSEACSLHVQVQLACHSSGRHGFDVLDADAPSSTIIDDTLRFKRFHLLD
jgi:dienelactone hydrolase